MKRLLIVAGAVAALAAPTAAAAHGPSKADKREAKKECRAERGTSKESRKAFRAEHGNFRACVREKAKENRAERRHAQKECREERGDTAESREAFREKYGTNRNKRNAFGKCVSKKDDD